MKDFIKKYYLRFILLVLGTSLIGIASAFFVLSTIGSNSITTFCLGISSVLSKIFNKEISSGIGIIIGNALFALILLIFARKYLNIGTILSIIIVGPICNLVLYLNLFKTSENLFICILYSLSAILVSGIGVALIIKADIGISAFDGVSLFLNDLIKKINYSIIRILFDLILLLLGFVMGAVVGWGTILAVLLTGPTIYIFNKLFSLTTKFNKNINIDENKAENVGD